MSNQAVFDSTDNPEAQEAQKEAEAKSLAIGEKIVNEQQEAEAEVFEKARKDAESQINYAGKFRSAEDLEKAYIELERKLGQPKEEQPQDEEQPDEPEQVREEEGQQGDNEEGEEAPPPSITQEEELAIVEQVGGLDSYQKALDWAGENLKPNEIQTFNSILASGNKDLIEFAVVGLVGRFKNSDGFEGTPVSGKAIRGQGGKPFRSQAELARAIGNPKYQNDPAYRLDIEQRLAASGDLL
jgi:hypothetical protein